MKELNELDRVRELYPDPPAPSAHTIAAARAKMVVQAPTPTRNRRRVKGFAISVAAAGTTVALVIVTGGGGGGSGNHERAASELSGRQILLAAAEKAAAEPIGRYWRVHSMGENVIGHLEGNSYVLSSRSEAVWWEPRTNQNTEYSFHRDLGTSPATEADRVAWVRAGSPQQWRFKMYGNRVDGSRSPIFHWQIVKIRKPDPWTTYRLTPEDRRKRCYAPCDPNRLTYDKLEQTAAQPGGLERLVASKRFPIGRLKMYPRRAEAIKSFRPAEDLVILEGLLASPASPQTRAKLFKLLAEQPAIRNIGKIKDRTGRTGIGLAARGGDPSGLTSGTFEHRLILDPVTYKVLGTEMALATDSDGYPGLKPGHVISSFAYLQSGWTDEQPSHP